MRTFRLTYRDVELTSGLSIKDLVNLQDDIRSLSCETLQRLWDTGPPPEVVFMSATDTEPIKSGRMDYELHRLLEKEIHARFPYPNAQK